MVDNKDLRRTELLNAASELLAVKPTAALSEIADHAGIGKATLHRYFPSRDDLMLALGLRALDRVAQAIATAQIDQGTAAEAFTRLFEQVVPLGDKLHFLVSEPLLDKHPDFLEADQRVQDPIRALIRRGQASGELRADLPIEWMVLLINYAVFAMWQSVHAGFTARRDAPRLLAASLLGGLATR